MSAALATASRPQPLTALTADLVARAVIASARVFGDDPERALTTIGGRNRRCLAPAILGLRAATGHATFRLRNLLGVANSMRTSGGDVFLQASMAAERAARYALWRPDAAVSAAPPPPVVRVLTLVAPVARAVLAPTPGRITAALRPSFSPPAEAKPESALRDRILVALDGGSLTSQGLATILDAKELYVAQTLTALAYEGLVDAIDPPPPADRRDMRWHLCRRAAV